MKSIFLSVLLAAFLSVNSFGAMTDPTSAQVTIYGVALSPNADCSNATVIGYNPQGTTYDFLQNPNIVTGNIAPGTYQCVILYMKALLTFVPKTSTGNCVAGTTYTRAICNGGCSYTQATPDANNVLQFGSVLAASAVNSQDITHADKVLLFISTGSVGTGNQAFQQPTTPGSSNGINLGSPLTVAEAGTTGTFVVNFTGQVNGAQNPCDLGPPTFTFR